MYKLIKYDSITSTAIKKGPAKVHPILRNTKTPNQKPVRRELRTEGEVRKEEKRRHNIRMNHAIGRARKLLNLKKKKYHGRRMGRKERKFGYNPYN